MNTYRDSRKKGTVTIDAAIGLPVFLLAMGLLLCLMLQLEAEERRFCELRDRALTDMEIRGAVSRLSRGNLVVEGVRELKSRVRLKLPSLSAQKKTDALEYLVYRPFIGAQSEAAEDDTRVYVFPKRGQRYHIRSCIILQEGAVETVLSSQLRKRYAACRICKPDKLRNGAPVYMFSLNSTVFHRKSCASISKAFVSMSRSQAEREGYTPCMICFGGSHE